MRNLIIIFAILCGFASFSVGQQLPHFRYQDFNSIFLNPAYIAKHNSPDIFLNHRSQWVGFSGAPTITSLAGKYKLRNDMAGGAIISNDLTGPTRRTYFNINYAYILKADQFNINFGLAWNFTNYRIRGDLISIHEQNDLSVIQNLNDAAWKPDANIGLMLSGEKFYLGLGVQQAFKSKFRFYKSNESFGNIQSTRHIFINGAYHINTRYDEGIITPQVNLYIVKGAPFKMDLIVNFLHQSNVSGSLMFSSGDALVVQIGYQHKQYIFNYSYDLVVSRLRNVNSGAHEIGLAMFIKDRESGISSPSF